MKQISKKMKKILTISATIFISIIISGILAIILIRILNYNKPNQGHPFDPYRTQNKKPATPSEPETPTIVTTNDDYPFELPSDAPFGFEEIDRLYENAQDRFYFFYYEDSPHYTKEQFEEIIQPYFKLFVASMEYSFEKYEKTFRGDNPKLDERTNLRITVYQKCTSISDGLTEETCSDIKIIGSTNPFTYSTGLYVNPQHPDFSPEFIIDIGMHEVIHLLQYTYQYGTSTGMPDWFKESMAVDLAYSSSSKHDLYQKDYKKYGAAETLSILEENFHASTDTAENLGKLRSAYYVSGLYWEYLMQQTTLEEYLTLIPVANTYRSWRDDTEFNKKFEQIVGKSPNESYEDFLDTLIN